MNVMQRLQADWDHAALVAPDLLPDPRPSWSNAVIAALAIALTMALAVTALWAVAP